MAQIPSLKLVDDLEATITSEWSEVDPASHCRLLGPFPRSFCP